MFVTYTVRRTVYVGLTVPYVYKVNIEFVDYILSCYFYD